MKVLFLLESRKTPSSRFRGYNYTKYLEKTGVKYRVIAIPKNFIWRLSIFFPILFCDVVFIQKKVFHIWELVLIRILASKVIYDIDDAIMFIEKTTEEKRERRNINRNKRLFKTLNTADYIIAGNNYLAEFIRKFNTNIKIIPTPVDTKAYHVIKHKLNNRDIVIGWIGTEGNLKYLFLLKHVFKNLKEKYNNIILKIVCDKFIDLDKFSIQKKFWKLEDEVRDLQSFDIGIMPLKDDEWARGKCGFKILQYMAVGIPSVSSPVGVNSEIVQDGFNGFLAKDDEEWIEKLSILIENRDLRMKMGERGREYVERNYSLDITFPEFKGVLEDVFLDKYKKDKKPHILHTESSDGWGGQEMRILMEAEEFSKRGYKVLLGCYPNSGLMKNAEKRGIRTVPIAIKNYFDFLSIFKIYRLIKKEKIDIVNTHSSKDSWVASFSSKMIGRRKPLLIRTRHLSVPISTHLFNFIYKMPDMIITTCESTRKEMIHTNRVKENQVVTIPTGVVLEKFDIQNNSTDGLKESLGINDKSPIISKIAVLRSWKRHDTFLEAARKIIQEIPEARFLIVGEGPQKKNIAKKIKLLELERNVIMTGYREDIPGILAMSDISVLVSDSAEGVPQAVVQSLAMKKPVIGTNVGGISELIIDGETGILIEPNNPEILAEKILMLLRNKEYAKRLGEAGRKLVEERFSCQMMVEKLEKLYQESLK